MSSHWFTGYLVLSANTGAMIQVPCIYLFFLFLPLPLPEHLKAKQQSSCCQRTRNPRAAPHSQAPETATASPMRASSVPCAKRKARDEDFRPHLDRDSRGATFGSMAPSTPSTTGSCHMWHSSQPWRWINVNYHWITLLWLMTVLYLWRVEKYGLYEANTSECTGRFASITPCAWRGKSTSMAILQDPDAACNYLVKQVWSPLKRFSIFHIKLTSMILNARSKQIQSE